MRKSLKKQLVNTAILIVSFTLMTVPTDARPNTRNREEIPAKYKWDLSLIYPDWASWESDLARLEKLMDQYAKLKGTLAEGPDALAKAFKMGDEMGIIAYKVYRYPQLSYDVDTRRNEISAKLQQVQILFAKFDIATAWFNPELLAIPWDTMKNWLEQTEDLAPYSYTIRNLYRQQEHVLDERGEQLLSYYTRFNSSPPSIYTDLSTTDISYPEVTLPGGDEVTMSPGQYYYILSTNRSQEARRTAFESFYGLYSKNTNTYASIYNSICQRDWANAQARKYASTLEAALNGNNIPVSVVENIINTVKTNTEPLRRYLRLRKKTLGLDSYHLYDGSIPLVDWDQTYDYDTILDWIVASVAPLGKEYQEKLEKAIASGWIDVYENEGKRSGAYSAGVYGVHPYMLMNFNGTLEGVFTTAHELGHTMHTLLSYENQPFATASYTIFVAEVASTLNEALFLDYMMQKSTDPKEKVALLQQAISNITGTFYMQVMFADFELQAHRLVEKGRPITADALREVYRNLLVEYYGDTLDMDELYEATWTRISHFYASPYYVYQYATCFASAATLMQDIQSEKASERKEAVERYLTLLKSGGDDYPMNQLKKAGVDLTKAETIRAVIEQLDTLVSKLEEELKKS